MNTIEIIRQIGKDLAFKNEIFGGQKIEDIEVPNSVIDDFIERLKNDLFEFQTLEQFDPTSFNLFCRAFMYVYGKGAEFAFFSRIGSTISTINYDFDKAMQGVCGEKLTNHFRFQINRKSNAMLEMYCQMFALTKGSQEKLISEGFGFPDCIRTILTGAFTCGIELCLTIDVSKEDRHIIYVEELDSPYDYDNYDKIYKVEDFKIINYSIGKFDDISGL